MRQQSSGHWVSRIMRIILSVGGISMLAIPVAIICVRVCQPMHMDDYIDHDTDSGDVSPVDEMPSINVGSDSLEGDTSIASSDGSGSGDGTGNVDSGNTDIANDKGGTIRFAGYSWVVRSVSGLPGPNDWSKSSVWVDENGWMHLKIVNKDGKWYCADVCTIERLGFGRYEFEVIGPIDKMDQNVVLGLFNYPTKDVGSSGTCEIDMEFSWWGGYKHNGFFGLWGTQVSSGQVEHNFDITLSGNYSSHVFYWRSSSVLFQSYDGIGGNSLLESWEFAPDDYLAAIAQNPMPLHVNLWLFRGNPPSDGKEVEIVIKNFTFVPL